MRIENHLRVFRRRRGYTLKELSRISGISVSEISSIENGAIQDPGIYVCSVLARALEAEISEIFELMDGERRI